MTQIVDAIEAKATSAVAGVEKEVARYDDHPGTVQGNSGWGSVKPLADLIFEVGSLPEALDLPPGLDRIRNAAEQFNPSRQNVMMPGPKYAAHFRLIASEITSAVQAMKAEFKKQA